MSTVGQRKQLRFGKSISAIKNRLYYPRIYSLNDQTSRTISPFNLRFHIYREDWSHTNVKGIKSENFHPLRLSVSVEPSNWYWSRRFRNRSLLSRFVRQTRHRLLHLPSLFGQPLRVANLAKIPFSRTAVSKVLDRQKKTNSQSRDLIQHLAVERGFFYQFSQFASIVDCEAGEL